MINKSGFKADPMYTTFHRHNPSVKQSKTNNFLWHMIKSLFQINTYKKQLLSFSLEVSSEQTPSPSVPFPGKKKHAAFYQYLPSHKNVTYPWTRYHESLCPLFFIKLLFFRQIIALQKLWQVSFFISSKKLLFFSRYSNFCNFFHSFSHFPDTKG